MPAAVQPANVATPTSSGHTIASDELLARDLRDVVEILKDGL
jgi:hypothetical protein